MKLRHCLIAGSCVLGTVLAACNDRPTAPAPWSPPPATEPAPPPPPQSGLAGRYELELQLSPSCAAPGILSYFPGSARSARSRTYLATIAGPDPALVHIADENVGNWSGSFGDSFIIEQDGDRVKLLSMFEVEPEIMEQLPGGEWLIAFFDGGTGEVVGDRIEATWQGTVNLGTIEFGWFWGGEVEACQADDHGLRFYPRETE